MTCLRVFDRLEVGPVVIERRKLTAPYRLFFNGTSEQFDLIYSFEEDVFDPSEPESIKLAGMIGAQTALNYGLFCDVLQFNGSYDKLDRRFLRTMAENTAKEIYVKKFLEPNPFLIGAAANLKPVKRKRYLQATIRFFPSSKVTAGRPWRLWPTRKERVCVLSSGGKESLLGFGLLNEIAGGSETAQADTVHPIFINESGRHWFTALNAFRRFKDSMPNTGRVWVNSDRLFSWMLKRMPFIRPDFASVRSDEYPIRIWTVAVFLFGALPLMRKRGIGRIVIGDEFDTSIRAKIDEISHYDGLYDQSIWFDQALSRYFLQKGWSISQFSLLRPLSELLVETILTRRYPELQKLQTSCHATHKEDDRIRPCGRCGKCRRVVGMLMAIGANPQACGYSQGQIDVCLKRLIKEGAHQEAPAVRYMLHILARTGRITSSPSISDTDADVLKLRFDPERSPVNGIPVDLRKAVYRIFLEYADGAIRRIGRRWEAFDVMTDPDLRTPYTFETDSRVVQDNPDESGAHGSSSPRPYIWGDLTWPEAGDRLRETDVAILPVGALEQHGPHLPLDTDAFDARYLAHRVASTCSAPSPLVLPLIPYGVSYHHDGFTGTVSIGNDTLSRLVYDVGVSVARNGIRKLVILNAHGGNAPALNHAAQMINRDARIFVCVDTGETSDVDIAKTVRTRNDVHAGEIETSTTLAVRPGMVRKDRLESAVPEFPSRYLNFSSKRGVSWYAYTRKISNSGVMGDPTRADVEKGYRIWEIMIAHLVALVEDLKSMPLEDIYRKR